MVSLLRVARQVPVGVSALAAFASLSVHTAKSQDVVEDTRIRPPALDAPSPSNESALRAMRAIDASLEGDVTLAFEISVPFAMLGPDTGPHRKKCRFVSDRTTRTLLVATEYENDPIFYRPGAGGTDPTEFDDDGNLLVSRSLRKRTLSNSDANVLVDEQEYLTVAPTGQVRDRSMHTQVYVFPIGSVDGLYEADQFRMAAGYGFAENLRVVREEEWDASRKRGKVVAEGDYGGRIAGVWTFGLERTQDSTLVRRATFLPNGTHAPSIVVTTDGWMSRDGIAIASHGSLTYPRAPSRDYVLDVRLIEFSTVADQTQLREFRAAVAPLTRSDTKAIGVGTTSPQGP